MPLTDTAAVLALATAVALVVCGLGWPMLRRVRSAGVGASVAVVLLCAVVSMVAGVVIVSWRMFLSAHDLRVTLIVVVVSASVSSLAAWRMAYTLREEAVWAESMANQEAQMESGRQRLLVWVSEDLRSPIERIQVLTHRAETETDPAARTEAHRRIAEEAARMADLVDDVLELTRLKSQAQSAAAGTPADDEVTSVLPRPTPATTW